MKSAYSGYDVVWVFHGTKSSFASGVFATREDAEAWIATYELEGMLTAYPVGVSVYDWACYHGLFTPRRDDQKSPEFIQQFTSASQDHYHYESGKRAG